MTRNIANLYFLKNDMVP